MKAKKKVRFPDRDEDLERVRTMPGKERKAAARARRGGWHAAPYHDELWDGDTGSMRAKELTQEELKALLKLAARQGAPRHASLRRGLKSALVRVVQVTVPAGQDISDTEVARGLEQGGARARAYSVWERDAEDEGDDDMEDDGNDAGSGTGTSDEGLYETSSLDSNPRGTTTPRFTPTPPTTPRSSDLGCDPVTLKDAPARPRFIPAPPPYPSPRELERQSSQTDVLDTPVLPGPGSRSAWTSRGAQFSPNAPSAAIGVLSTPRVR